MIVSLSNNIPQKYNNGMAKVKKKKQVRKIYIYNYPKNRELGARLKGMSGFIGNSAQTGPVIPRQSGPLFPR